MESKYCQWCGRHQEDLPYESLAQRLFKHCDGRVSVEEVGLYREDENLTRYEVDDDLYLNDDCLYCLDCLEEWRYQGKLRNCYDFLQCCFKCRLPQTHIKSSRAWAQRIKVIQYLRDDSIQYAYIIGFTAYMVDSFDLPHLQEIASSIIKYYPSNPRQHVYICESCFLSYRHLTGHVLEKESTLPMVIIELIQCFVEPQEILDFDVTWLHPDNGMIYNRKSAFWRSVHPNSKRYVWVEMISAAPYAE